jgi:hypothetical protein
MKTYRDICPQGTPEAERRKYNIGDIYHNKAQCLICNTIVESNHRHDYQTCECGNIAVDGGSWYGKGMCGKDNTFLDLTEYYNTDRLVPKFLDDVTPAEWDSLR